MIRLILLFSFSPIQKIENVDFSVCVRNFFFHAVARSVTIEKTENPVCVHACVYVCVCSLF